MNEPLISILHATRNRPQQMYWAYDLAMSRAVNRDNIEYIWAFDEDDPTKEDVIARVKAGMMSCYTKVVVGPKDQGNNGAWNRAYRNSRGKVVLQHSDDFECPQAWDQICLERIDRAGGLHLPFVLGVADPHFTGDYSGDGLLTIFLATRAYCDKTGYKGILYPEYPSLFSDNDVREKAAMDDMLIDAYDIKFYHHWHGHPDDPLRDSTYTLHATSWHNDTGRWVFADRTWACFPDIEWDDPERDMTDKKEYCGAPFYDDVEGYIRRRKELGYAAIRNKEFPEGSYQRLYLEGKYKEAREGVEELMSRYHLKICGGRFLLYGAHHIWEQCTKILGDKPLVDLRDHHR